MNLKTKALHIKSVEGLGHRVKRFTASDESIDADGDIVKQDFVLDRFMKNPVILFAHKSREFPIGKAVDIGVANGELKVDIEFAPAEANPEADKAFQLIELGMLNAVSIGFIPGEVHKEMVDGKEAFVLSKNVLHEISVTPIGSNENALADAKAKAIKEFLSTKDDAAIGGQEKSMNEKEFKELQATKARLEKELGEANVKLEVLQKRYEQTEELYTEEKAKAAKLQSEACEKRVQELVGKKISPTEVASLVKLACIDIDLFEEHMTAVEARPEMPHVKGSELPTGTDEGAPSLKDLPKDQEGSSSFADLVNQSASRQ